MVMCCRRVGIARRRRSAYSPVRPQEQGVHVLRRIGYVVVFVKNWEEAMRFYAETLGVEVVRRADEQGVAEFRFPGGGPNLMVEQVDKCDFDARALVGQYVGMSVTAS